MAQKNRESGNIPGIIILLALVFCWPVGIFLAILRIALRTQNQKTDAVEEKSTPVAPSHTASKSENRKKKPRRSAGTILSQIGMIAAALLIPAVMWVCLTAGNPVSIAIPSAIFCSLPFVAVTGGFAALYHFFSQRDVRMARIRAIIGSRQSINLMRLSAASGGKLKKVKGDLQKMIDRGEFGDYAYIDLGTNNFMRTPDAIPDAPEQFDYRIVYGDLFKKEERDKSTTDQEAEGEPKVEEDGDYAAIIQQIRRLNDEIQDAEVSERIDRIEAHTRNIFDYVTDHPEAKPQIRTFLNYYLPTTLKLLESYSRIERVGVAGENMRKSKENIERILDLLAVGFEQQVDQLFRNESIDISSDVSVLETMMKKDGLSGKDGFDMASYVDAVTDEINGQSGGAAGAADRNHT